MIKELVNAQLEYLRQWEQLGAEVEIAGFKNYISIIAGQLPNQHEAVARLAFAMSLQGQIMQNHSELSKAAVFYDLLAALANEHAVANDLPEQYAPHHFATKQLLGEIEIAPAASVSYEQAGVISDLLRQKGQTTGFLHGHFRLFTPASIAYLINAAQRVDLLIIGLEAGQRTARYKNKQPLLTDPERLWLTRHFFPVVVLVDQQTSYDDAGYTQLCQAIKPDMYFGQSDNPAQLRVNMRQRALTVPNCEYMELPAILGPHTSTITQALQSILKL